MLEFSGSSLLWRFLPVGGVGLMVCQVVLVRELDLFSLVCNKVYSSEFLDVYEFGVTLGSLYFNAQGYIPVLLEN